MSHHRKKENCHRERFHHQVNEKNGEKEEGKDDEKEEKRDDEREEG